MWYRPDMHAFQQVVHQVAVVLDALHHLIYYSTLTHAVDSAQDIHPAVKVPYHMLPAAPQRVDFNLFYILSVFHSRPFFASKIVKTNETDNLFAKINAQLAANNYKFPSQSLFLLIFVSSEGERQSTVFRNRRLEMV